MEKIIREARKDDSIAVWKIRNHPALRPWFNSTEEIELGSHDDWFQNKYFKEKVNECFVLEIMGKVVGYCRFDLDGSNYVISIALDQNYQGHGLGNELLSQSMKLLRYRRAILAEVKKENLASLKVFENNEFKKYKKDGKNIYLKRKKEIEKV